MLHHLRLNMLDAFSCLLVSYFPCFRIRTQAKRAFLKARNAEIKRNAQTSCAALLHTMPGDTPASITAWAKKNSLCSLLYRASRFGYDLSPFDAGVIAFSVEDYSAGVRCRTNFLLNLSPYILIIPISIMRCSSQDYSKLCANWEKDNCRGPKPWPFISCTMRFLCLPCTRVTTAPGNTLLRCASSYVYYGRRIALCGCLCS